MTRTSLFLLTLFLAPTVASAQKPIVELGAGLGVTTESGGDSFRTRIHPALIASFFKGDHLGRRYSSDGTVDLFARIGNGFCEVGWV